ncbi:MAG: hypothetical protein IJE00_04525 [Clostridia bacterium]|nr:hypothetical protein [Clostridia bacterium]
MKQYQMPTITVIHIETPHTLDLSGGGDFWGEEPDDGDISSLSDDYVANT